MRWLADNWIAVVVPLLVIVATFTLGWWLRRILTGLFERWAAQVSWGGRITQLMVGSFRRPFLFWFLLLGMLIATEASTLPDNAKITAGKMISSLFVLSLALIAITLSQELFEFYMPKMKVPRPTVELTLSLLIILFLVTSVLITLDVWGVPTTPFLIIVGIVVFIAVLGFRNVAPNAFAALHMWNSEHVKAGDYIRLETGEEGYVIEINWNSTHIKTLNETKVVIPNNRLIQSKFINYGQPERVTRELFTFKGKTVPRELPALNPGEPIYVESPFEAEGGRLDVEIKSVLSDREKEIARLISEGVGNREIGERLFIAENTVKVHVKNILKKLELRNRQQLAAYTAIQKWAMTGEGKKPE